MRPAYDPAVTFPNTATAVSLLTAVVLGREECWCSKCGETVMRGEQCPRCSSREYVDPTKVLTVGEYITL
jgi:hypothetical protein